jgi:hypothetical protein
MQRSSVELLPEEIRQELEKRLIQGGFAGYANLAEWLAENGYEISRSSVHRYGKKFEDKLRALKVATDQAKAIAEASEDDAGAMNDAIIRLVQTKTFELLVELEADEKSLPRIGQMVAKLAQAAVRQKKWQTDMEEQIRAKALEDAAEAVEAAAAEKGFNTEQAEFWRQKVLGVK